MWDWTTTAERDPRELRVQVEMIVFGARTSGRTATMRTMRLSGVDFTGLNLTGADFTDATLKGADLSGACCVGADFLDAYLVSVRAAGACFRGANLAGANLAGADLTGADLAGADMTDACLLNARYDPTQLLDVRGLTWDGRYGRRLRELRGELLPDDPEHRRLAEHLINDGWDGTLREALETAGELARR